MQDDTKKTDIKNEELEKVMEEKRSRFEEIQRYGHIFDKEDPKAVAAKEEASKRRHWLDESQKETQEKERVKVLPTAAEQLEELKKREADAKAWTLDPSRSNADYEAGAKKLNDLTKERMEMERKVAEENKKTAKEDASNALKREELDLSVRIAEAQAAGNDKLLDKLKWQQAYNKLLKEYPLTKEGKVDPQAFPYAIQGANAAEAIADQKSDDKLATAKRIAEEARSAIPRSHMASIGGAMGESAVVNASVQLLKQQLTIAQEQTKSQQAIATNTKNTATSTDIIAKKPGGFG